MRERASCAVAELPFLRAICCCNSLAEAGLRREVKCNTERRTDAVPRRNGEPAARDGAACLLQQLQNIHWDMHSHWMHAGIHAGAPSTLPPAALTDPSAVHCTPPACPQMGRPILHARKF